MAKKINLPASESDIRALRAGDAVEISGVMVTGRDNVHKYLIEQDDEEARKLLCGSFIYHCGPVVRKQEDGSWTFVAAGPTTSIREEPYQAEVFKRYGVRAAIGKGGMGPKTLAGCQECGAVYLHAIGGLAVLLAKSVKKVRDVLWLEEFGSPEAMWVIEVEDFPAIVTMDAHGKSLHADVLAQSEAACKALLTQ
ncbi:FumA C-terminus/TtdB family hydratase beta subunit [Planctomycetota bacterium]